MFQGLGTAAWACMRWGRWMAAITLVAGRDQPEVARIPMQGLFQPSRVRKNRQKKRGLFCWGGLFCCELFVVVLTQCGTTWGAPQAVSALHNDPSACPSSHAWRSEGCSLCSQ